MGYHQWKGVFPSQLVCGWQHSAAQMSAISNFVRILWFGYSIQQTWWDLLIFKFSNIVIVKTWRLSCMKMGYIQDSIVFV